MQILLDENVSLSRKKKIKKKQIVENKVQHKLWPVNRSHKHKKNCFKSVSLF